jgi:hypothetical protein
MYGEHVIDIVLVIDVFRLDVKGHDEGGWKDQ